MVSFGNFWGMLKVPGAFNPITVIVLIFELLCFIYLIRQREKRNYYLWMIFIFGWVKQIVFISQKSLFDWYYWVPQLLLLFLFLFLYWSRRREEIYGCHCLYCFILFRCWLFKPFILLQQEMGNGTIEELSVYS